MLFITRDTILRDKWPVTTACPACWVMVTNERKYFVVRKKYFLLGRLEWPRQVKKCCACTKSPTNQHFLLFVILCSYDSALPFLPSTHMQPLVAWPNPTGGQGSFWWYWFLFELITVSLHGPPLPRTHPLVAWSTPDRMSGRFRMILVSVLAYYLFCGSPLPSLHNLLLPDPLLLEVGVVFDDIGFRSNLLLLRRLPRTHPLVAWSTPDRRSGRFLMILVSVLAYYFFSCSPLPRTHPLVAWSIPTEGQGGFWWYWFLF